MFAEYTVDTLAEGQLSTIEALRTDLYLSEAARRRTHDQLRTTQARLRESQEERELLVSEAWAIERLFNRLCRCLPDDLSAEARALIAQIDAVHAGVDPADLETLGRDR